MYYKKNQILVKILLSESVIDDEKKNLNSYVVLNDRKKTKSENFPIRQQ